MDGLVEQLIDEAKGVLGQKSNHVWRKFSEEQPKMDGEYEYILIVPKSYRYVDKILICKRYFSSGWSPIQYSGLIGNSQSAFEYWMPFDFWTKFDIPKSK